MKIYLFQIYTIYLINIFLYFFTFNIINIVISHHGETSYDKNAIIMDGNNMICMVTVNECSEIHLGQHTEVLHLSHMRKSLTDESSEAYSLNFDVNINPGHQIGMRNRNCFPYC